MVVLLLIFMSNQFAETLGDAAADLLPRDAVFRVFGLQFLQYLALLAPVGLLLGVLLALARLNRDSEMSALAACGVGPLRLLRPIGLFSLAFAGLVGWLSLFAAPGASRAIEEIRFETEGESDFGDFVPGTFRSIHDGSTTVYQEAVDGDLLKGVFYQAETADGIEIVMAEEAEQVVDDATGDMALLLRNGQSYEITPGEARAVVSTFREHGIPIRLEPRDLEFAIASRPTVDLLWTTDPDARAELQWRLAAPLSILILALLAVPLGRSTPREGKYARVGLGLLIYIIYANSLSITLVWVERELVPPWLGSWWVHAVLGLFAALMLARQSGLGLRPQVTTGIRHEPTG